MSARFFTLSISRRASADIAAAKAWLTQPGSGKHGWGRYAELNRSVLDLRRNPLRWPIGEDPATRERPTGGYRILYAVDEGRMTVVILRVFGPNQDRDET